MEVKCFWSPTLLTLELGRTVSLIVHVSRNILPWNEILVSEHETLLLVVPVSTDDW